MPSENKSPRYMDHPLLKELPLASSYNSAKPRITLQMSSQKSAGILIKSCETSTFNGRIACLVALCIKAISLCFLIHPVVPKAPQMSPGIFSRCHSGLDRFYNLHSNLLSCKSPCPSIVYVFTAVLDPWIL